LLEGKLADEEPGRLLVTTDFTKSDSFGLEVVGHLDTTSSGLERLCRRRGGRLFTASFATGRLVNSLLGHSSWMRVGVGKGK